MKTNDTNFVFFGTDEFAVGVLNRLKELNLTPELIVTTPDKPAGRKLELTPPPVKLWALENNVALRSDLKDAPRSDLFVVASYGQILSRTVLDLPTHGTLNIHPSLLPKYRGPTPIQAAILSGETETGVTIIKVDEQVDHGPIVVASSCQLSAVSFPELRDRLAKMGAELLIKILPDYLAGKIKPTKQNHAQATFTKKIKKTDGEIKLAPTGASGLSDDPEKNYRKFLAYQPWPGIFFFENGKRIKITAAAVENNEFIIKKVIPEGKPERRYLDNW